MEPAATTPPGKDAKSAKARPDPTPPLVANTADLTQLSDDDLRAMISLAEQELTARREKTKAEFLSYVREQSRALGYDAAEVKAAFATKGKRATTKLNAGDKRAAVAPKYRNPANHAETWAGRGAKPEWVRVALEAGKNLDDFSIKDTPKSQ
jgi:DNA-binding protein H-NS